MTSLNFNQSVSVMVGGVATLASLAISTSPASAFKVTMTPPGSLSLDGVNITTGVFSVNSATGFYIDNGQVVSEGIVDETISFNATIGSGFAHKLFEADNKFLAIQYEGSFAPNDNGANSRDYHLTVGSFNGGNNPDWTVFLPSTMDFAYQVTNLGDPTSDHNNETFTDDLPMLFASEQAAMDAGKLWIEELTNENNPNVQSIWVGHNNNSDVPFLGHGGGSAVPVPEPLTILGSTTALGIGGLLKREHSKNRRKANRWKV